MVRRNGALASMEVAIPVDGVTLPGDVVIPEAASGFVVFVHGSGSSRFSPRNLWVANALNESGLGTLLMDLLTPEEERVDDRTRALRFDISMLGSRVTQTLDWLAGDSRFAHLRFGCFGASTGAAAGLTAAAARPSLVQAVVSRGGRPDLAGAHLRQVRAATLLIVGGADQVVLDLNARAFRDLTCEKRLEVIPGASHLFEERGALDAVARLARDWFARHLTESER